MNETNLYLEKKHNFRIGVFADDILAGYKGELTHEYKVFKKACSILINMNIETLDICPVVKFIRQQITHDREAGTITIRHTQFIEAVAKECEGQFEPQESPHGVSKEDRAKFENLEPAPEADRIDKGKYLKLMGKIVWPANTTRPDVAMDASWLCSFVQSCGDKHYRKALGVLGYL